VGARGNDDEDIATTTATATAAAAAAAAAAAVAAAAAAAAATATAMATTTDLQEWGNHFEEGRELSRCGGSCEVRARRVVRTAVSVSWFAAATCSAVDV